MVMTENARSREETVWNFNAGPANGNGQLTLSGMVAYPEVGRHLNSADSFCLVAKYLPMFHLVAENRVSGN